MMCRFLKGDRGVRTLTRFLVLTLLAGLGFFPTSACADDCSPYIGDMTINEVYELGNDSWVEVRLLDTSVAKTVYDQWSIRVCDGKWSCKSYPISAGNVLYPETYPGWITLPVDKSYVDLQKNGGMDIVLRDENNKAIDYLSANNATWHQPNCSGFLYPTATGSFSSDKKGIYRDPDGTGPWVELTGSGATGEPTTGYDNNDKGLVVHYALEGDVTDSSLNGNNGSASGTVAYQRAKICDGVQLDGNGYLQVPDSNDLDLKDALTVTAWIYPDSLSVPGHDSLYSILSKDNNYEFHIQNNGALYWWWGNGSFTTGAGVIPSQSWSHVAFVYSKAAGTMQVYVNGQQVASHSYSVSLPVNSSPFLIGADIATGGAEITGRRFYGSIDEVRIYDRALSSQQISDLKNETDPCGLPTPLAEWRFDECGYDGVAALAEDAQGSYDATAQGGVVSEPDGVVGRAAMLDRSADSFLTNVSVPMWSDWTVSTWFRMPFTHEEGSRYHVLGAMAGGGHDLLWVDRNNGYRWGGWANNTSRTGTYQFSTLADGWHHLVAIAQDGKTDLYIDGVWKDSISLQPYGNLHFVGTSYEQAGGEEGFRSDLDEFLVFNGVLTDTQISTLYNLQAAGLNLDGTVREDILCGPAIDHFEMVHDSSALTCAPETVTIRACTDADCNTLYTDDVDITLSPAGWVGGNTQTLTGGSGDFRLRHTTPGTVTLSVSGNPTADHGLECVDGAGGSSCSLVFHEAGFIF